MANIKPYQREVNIERLLATIRGKRSDCVPRFEILIKDEHMAGPIGRPAGTCWRPSPPGSSTA